jgi:FkbM family methyltransferase
MQEFRGLYFPDGDVRLPETIAAEIANKGAPEFDGLPTFQFRKFAKSFPFIRNFRHAVDVGSHVGLWSRVFSRMFAHVTAFEPMPWCRECFERNIRPEDRARITLHPCALGLTSGELTFHYKTSNSGITHVQPDGRGDVRAPVRRLDEFALTDVDFLKIDVEGFEANVVTGGFATIARCRPTIIVEQKPNSPQRYALDQLGAVRLLQSLGAVVEFEWSGDYCLRWK